MASRHLGSVISQLCRAADRSVGGLTDVQLLEQFVSGRVESAFELLVWRHGTTILSLCRRLLGDAQEAEDAFQATFLVLARKASSIRTGQSVGAWLYQVAYRVSLRARAEASQRGPPVPPADDLPARESNDDVVWRDLRPVLQEEIHRLPEKYRAPFVLCYLEGHTNEEAARQLGCPRGTVLSRLARGRERLRSRLAGRGLTLSAGGLAALVSQETAAAAVPSVLVSLTTQAALSFAAGNAVAAGLVSTRAIAWTEGVLRAMWIFKLKIAAVVLALAAAIAGTGAGLLAQRPGADQAAEQRQERPRDDGRREAPAPEVRGVVKAVDAAKNTLTLTIGGGREPGMDRTFDLGKGVEILTGDARNRRGVWREAKLADLAMGALATVVLSADQKTVETVLAEGPTIMGAVKSVDAGQGTITLVTRMARGDDAAEEKTFRVGPGTEIAVDDGRGRRTSLQDGKLADLVPGAIATVKVTVNQQSVESIVVEGATIQGLVKAVDAAKNAVTVVLPSTERGGPGEERTYTLVPGAGVVIDASKGGHFSWREAKLADVPAGASVMLKLSPNQQTVAQLRAEGPSVHGLLKGVDAAKRTITLTIGGNRTEPGEDKTYTVAQGARILVNGAEAKLADLKVGDEPTTVALRLSLDQKAVQAIAIGTGRGR